MFRPSVIPALGVTPRAEGVCCRSHVGKDDTTDQCGEGNRGVSGDAIPGSVEASIAPVQLADLAGQSHLFADFGHVPGRHCDNAMILALNCR